ncbi:hypothetical protein MASR1M59_02530 [Melaminivora sp.]
MHSAADTPADQADTHQAAAFIARWQGVAASELSTAQSFTIELCQLLGVDKPISLYTTHHPPTSRI